MVSIEPTQELLGNVETTLNDSDRFKDMSLFIYQRNVDNFKKYLRNNKKLEKEQNQNNEDRNADDQKSQAYEQNVSSTVCTII